MELDCKVCNKCGARWIEGQLYWSTGAQGTQLDLAGLVCNNIKREDPTQSECINPQRGETGGQTWEYRRGFVDGALEQAMKQPKS